MLCKCDTLPITNQKALSEDLMKILPLLAVVCVVCASMLAVHTKGQSPNRAHIEIEGKRLTLGMTTGEVTNTIAGSTIHKIDDDFWGVGPEEPEAETVQFTKGRLTFAERYWTSTSDDIFDSLFGAVTTLNNQGFFSCQVQAKTNIQPDTSVRVVWIKCGPKSITVTRNTIGEKSFNEVHERLGDFRIPNAP
jgi:hypothetical protein